MRGILAFQTFSIAFSCAAELISVSRLLSVLKAGDDLRWNNARFQPFRIVPVAQTPHPHFAPLNDNITVVMYPMLDHEYLAAPFADPALHRDLVPEPTRAAKAGAGIDQRYPRHSVLREQLRPWHAAGAKHPFGRAIEPFEIARVKDNPGRIAIGEIDNDFDAGRCHSGADEFADQPIQPLGLFVHDPGRGLRQK